MLAANISEHQPERDGVPGWRSPPWTRFSASAQGLWTWPAYFGAKIPYFGPKFQVSYSTTHPPTLREGPGRSPGNACVPAAMPSFEKSWLPSTEFAVRIAHRTVCGLGRASGVSVGGVSVMI
eukprot:3747446-Prymnesium_polylepis.1